MNNWGIPKWLEDEVRKRDSACAYCGEVFVGRDGPRQLRPSWEHIINDARIITRENIVLCCIGCNSSKGAKDLLDWLSSRYCREKGISEVSVSHVVREAIQRMRQGRDLS